MRPVVGVVIIAVASVVGLGAGAFAQRAVDGGPDSPLPASAFDCPGGTAVDTYPSGSRVYAVARSADGGWLRVRSLAAPSEQVWVIAADVEADDAIDVLPVAECGEGSGTPTVQPPLTTTTTTPPETTTTEPSETTTTSTEPSGSSTSSSSTSTTSSSTTSTSSTTTVPTTGSTAPPTTTTTTEPPDTQPPTLGTPVATPNKIWEEDTDFLTCGDLDRESTISATASDSGSGIDSVVASWNIGGTPGSAAMAPSGNSYSGTFGPFPYLTIPDGTDQIITITVTARDDAGNQTTRNVGVRLHSTGTCFG